MGSAELILAYLGTFALAIVSSIGIPGPGDGALFAAGIAAAEGYLALGKVIAIGFFGGVIGCEIGYRIGYSQGRRLLEEPGPFFKVRRSMLSKGDALRTKYPRVASFFVPSVICGIYRIPRLSFFIFSTLSRAWWVLWTTLIAFYFGDAATELIHRVTRSPQFAIIVILALLVVVGRWVWVQRRPAAGDQPLGPS